MLSVVVPVVLNAESERYAASMPVTLAPSTSVSVALVEMNAMRSSIPAASAICSNASWSARLLTS